MVVTATVLAVDTLRAGSGAANLDLRLYLLFGGTVAGIALSAFAAWHLLGPLTSTYRRGGLAMVSAFATVVVMLICIPVNEMVGRTGLLGILGISAAAALVLGRRARRLKAGT
jgi:hypothetical protein